MHPLKIRNGWLGVREQVSVGQPVLFPAPAVGGLGESVCRQTSRKCVAAISLRPAAC